MELADLLADTGGRVLVVAALLLLLTAILMLTFGNYLGT